MEIAPRIIVDRNICHGAPVIMGTRVPISIIVGSLAGMSMQEVMCEYEITHEDIQAALAYAAEIVTKTELIELAGT
ncbi:DUF433 domain-containing protein [Candidatus Poribacteria bacterium]|nr:DUF433 domain-containing protein [Candidatus Poribacteria bacterium]